LLLGCYGEPTGRLQSTPKTEKQTPKPVYEYRAVEAVETPAAPVDDGHKGAATPVAKPDVSEAKAPNGPKVKTGKVGKHINLEVQGKQRRVLVDARICLREGSYGLETLLCRSGTKEHESILATDADARLIHFALVAAGAKPGSPVKYFEDKPPRPPRGTQIKVTLRYKNNKGKLVTVPAQNWIRNVKTKKDLEQDWVFAGSIFWKDPDSDPPDSTPHYSANGDGAYICVNNVPTAMLDLPIKSANNPEARVFQFHTKRIPPVGTKVTVILEPVPDSEKK
jgi:hypothetical protein